ncbi:FAD-binding oxidoreductase [soil metagenome]
MDFLNALRSAVPACPVLTDAADTAAYLTDWRGLFHGQALAVVRPGSVDDVSAIVRVAAAHGVAVVAQGGNTGLAGGAIPVGTRPQIVLSLTRMAKIRRIDRVGMTIEVEAGCIVQTAKDAAEQAGRFLPIAFAAQGSAMIGGVIATNAGGINALRYGVVRQLVLGLEAVLADGSIVRKLGGLRKDNAGYDWKQCLIGSEGTLGIVTAAVLRLAPVVRERRVAFISLESPAAALSLLERLQDTVGDTVSAFELMSGASVDRVVRHVGGRLPVAASNWYVLLEIADNASGLDDRVEQVLMAAAEAGDLVDAALADSLAQLEQFWALRENISEAERHAGVSIKHDIAVSVSDVPAFVEVATAALTALDPALELNAFGHLGDGNLHFNVLTGASRIDKGLVNRTVHDVVNRFGGSIAAEHGIGQYRVDELVRLRPGGELDVMQRIKAAFDPRGLLNPGKVVPTLPQGQLR